MTEHRLQGFQELTLCWHKGKALQIHNDKNMKLSNFPDTGPQNMPSICPDGWHPSCWVMMQMSSEMKHINDLFFPVWGAFPGPSKHPALGKLRWRWTWKAQTDKATTVAEEQHQLEGVQPAATSHIQASWGKRWGEGERAAADVQS